MHAGNVEVSMIFWARKIDGNVDSADLLTDKQLNRQAMWTANVLWKKGGVAVSLQRSLENLFPLVVTYN
jgi:hypothetical protein